VRQDQTAEPDVARVRELVRADPSLAREGRGLAIFSSAQAGVLEAVRLPITVEPMAVLDTLPWLEPLPSWSHTTTGASRS
jgi:hypothetical protein